MRAGATRPAFLRAPFLPYQLPHHDRFTSAKPSHQPTHFQLPAHLLSNFPSRRVCAEASPCSLDPALIDAVIIPPAKCTSHLTARHLQRLSLSILGKQTSIPVLLCSPRYRAEAHQCPLVCLADPGQIRHAGSCLLGASAANTYWIRSPHWLAVSHFLQFPASIPRTA